MEHDGLRFRGGDPQAQPSYSIYDNRQPGDPPTRRTVRTRTKPKKYGDFVEMSPTKTRIMQLQSSDDDNYEDMELSPQKPTALFSNDDVTGKDMFKFKSRHTKLDLHNKVSEAIMNSPKSPLKSNFKGMQCPRFSLSKENEATPKRVKDAIKKRIIQEVESDSDVSDFSGSSSDDFLPEESDKELELSSSSSSLEEQEAKPKKTLLKFKAVKEKQKLKPRDSEYYVTPDNYFMMNSSKKIATSDHTLSRLKNLDINENITGIQISTEHNKKISELNESYHQLFNKWLYILSEDFNIILYGIGSKRLVLQQFQKQKLNDFPCIVVNGYFPSLTMKGILEAIAVDLLENTYLPSNIGDVVNLIDSQLQENCVDLFLIVNNIDGPMLRNVKTQAALTSIAQLKNVHIIATIDHINGPLLWDHSKISKFRFTWWDVTTFLPYTEETSYENSLMNQRSGALQLSSLRSVYQSLTTNAKGIFNIIIEFQLENYKQAHYQGFPFKDLYSKCREQFLVSSDLALRAQLTEFLDHKLVKMKRTYDGSENLIIPIENTLLQEFLEKQNS
ncbi:hypothetical protein K1T71_005619 [Dendrolimus kikuchii]|uniref:Uncharacterized protein n=1 Tax=Dendrolimus kikuchii TaxID=765133 RepID=A0ACC1D4I6_9NEOP|nr:hypothetical protein K1T71_005619 [Dendrolimus kikuchii]